MRGQGKIRKVETSKGYGFIQNGDASDHFFHKSEVVGAWEDFKRGAQVSFISSLQEGKNRAIDVRLVEVSADIENNLQKVYIEEQGDVTNFSVKPQKRNRAGSYSGPTLELSEDQRVRALSDIGRWKLEARLDDIQRYFFAVPELNDIVTGDASYVIGRKGTGKTALVQYLSEKSDDDMLVTKLTFKNFPFNELYSQSNNSYTRPNQYMTLWKLIIYSAACKLIAKSTRTDPLVRQTIDKAFPPPNSDNLGTIIGKWIAGDLALTVLGTGVTVSKWFKDKKIYTLQEKVENLEQFVKKHMPDQKLLVLFDELDEDYKEMFESYKKSEYLDLLTSLFKAIQDIRANVGKNNRLFPVVFLRDDIYDLIQDADKNKWRDLEVDLEWNPTGMKKLLAHRLSKVMNTNNEDFDILWYSVFTSKALTYSNNKKTIASFDYIKMSAQGRPRDYINYLQECASMEIKRSKFEISVDTIKDADKAYSNYLKKELIDEMHGIIPEIAKVLSIFSESRKWILSIQEFRQAYQERVDAKAMTITDVEFVLRTLFYFSVIGNVVRVDLHIFRYERPDAQLNFKERIVVHRGLMKALQII